MVRRGWENARLFARLNPLLVIGTAMFVVVALFGLIGSQFANASLAKPGTTPLDLPPSGEYPLGTDSIGRDLLSVVMIATSPTLKVGLLAGAIGLGVGIVLGFVGGYYGGILDNLFKGSADILITVPVLLILVVIAVSLPGAVSVNMQALIIAGVAWMWPTRTIRAQVLTMRERPYVDVAKLSGYSGTEIIFKELLPNLLPYLAASFVTAVALSILATIGMDALGLGPQNDPTLGNTIYWAIFFSAPLRGLWWWWTPPIVLLGLIFVGLYLVSAGLDKIANPRLRRVG
jgi:peptide/nickel transport system permease protein